MNLEYFKRKFDTLCKQNNTKRKEIAAKTGIREEKITKLRDSESKYNTQPTVDDLIAISDYFDVTVDELIRPQTENKQEQFENMGQIIETLFSIDKEIGISIVPHTEHYDPYLDNIPLTKYLLDFDNTSMYNFISEWQTVKNNVENLPDYGASIAATWKDACIKKYSHYLKEFNYNAPDGFSIVPEELIREDSEDLPFK